MEILDGKRTSQEIMKSYKERIKMLRRKPCLAILSINPDEASQIYIKQKEKACKDMGMDLEKYIFTATTSKEEIVSIIQYLNEDDDIDGILLQLPVPNTMDAHDLINEIDPSKDVDGLTDKNIGGLMHDQDVLCPCTALGVIDLLDAYNVKLKGKNVLLIGRSNLVGKPLIPLFLNRDATITIVHTKTENLESYSQLADIIVVAAGSPSLIKADMVKEGAVIVDVGISRINGKLEGDVDFEAVKAKTSFITPVPGGVGPMTIQALIRNVYYAYLNRERKRLGK